MSKWYVEVEGVSFIDSHLLVEADNISDVLISLSKGSKFLDQRYDYTNISIKRLEEW